MALLEVLADAKPPAGLAGRITYHSPLTCPACAHSFKGTWKHCTGKEDQTCPACLEVWPEAWAGWEFQPRVTVADTDPCETVTAALDAVTVKP